LLVMTRWLHSSARLVAALLFIAAYPSASGAQTPAAVQVVVADAKVHLSADASSPVVSPVPVGATLAVVSVSGNWYAVRLPKAASGFDRSGFIQKASVKAAAAPAGGGVAPPAAGGSGGKGGGGGRPTTAVLDFDYGTITHWWSGTYDIGKGIADLL